MPSRRKTKWAGWLKPEDVSPETLERLLLYRDKYRQYENSLSSSSMGCGNYMQAHEAAKKDLDFTDEEFELYRRLDEDAYRSVDDKYR
jgi:hypothetical protein